MTKRIAFLLVITILIYGISLCVTLFFWAGGEFEMFDLLNCIFIILFYILGLWLIIFEISLVKKAICEYKKP
jgi:hypothetical protein